MLIQLLKDFKWILCGDFNMVEFRKDKILFCGQLLSNKEKLLWEIVEIGMKTEDRFTLINIFKYSWDNLRANG
jgi:hypothetical protein